MGRLGALRVALGSGLALAVLVACASAPGSGVGVYHAVRPGENLYRISRYYGVGVDDVKRVNSVGRVTELRVGQQLWIPGTTREPATAELTPPADVAARADRGGRDAARREADVDLAWPLKGRLSSRYGWRRGRMHEGIDIPARKGTPVRAAASGRVIHSGTLGSYGRVVIVKHAGRYSTVYAHNRKNFVGKGSFVEKGQVVAEVGTSGNARGSHLHFEVRRDRRPQDPLRYLP